MEKQLHSDILPFILAGKAIFTIVSKKTGTRFTYRVTKKRDMDLWFVSLLRGHDNENDYAYLGVIKDDAVLQTAKSKVSPGAPSYVAIRWTVERLFQNRSIEQIEVWHAGHCGRCGRLLTVPESIDSGFGPECIQLIGRHAA